MEIIRHSSPKVHPELERKWIDSYEQYAARHPDEPLESAAAFADATWEGVVPPNGGKIPGSPAVRVASVMRCETKRVPRAAVDAVEAWENKSGGAASPEEISAILGKTGIDPLLSQAQRTIPSAGLPSEVPSAPPAKKRGRPPKAPGSLAASAPPKPVAAAVSDREAHIRKAAKKLDDAARNIAQFNLSNIPELHRRRVVELALTHARVYDQEAEMRDAIEGDVR